jgi:hypothetical protein
MSAAVQWRPRFGARKYPISGKGRLAHGGAYERWGSPQRSWSFWRRTNLDVRLPFQIAPGNHPLAPCGCWRLTDRLVIAIADLQWTLAHPRGQTG